MRAGLAPEGKGGPGNRPHSPLQTLVNALLYRVDAWGTALIIAALALLIHEAVNRQTLLWLLAIVALYWFGYGINDYYDAPRDAQDAVKARRNFFVQFPIGRRAAALISLTISLFVLLAFLQFGRRGLVLLAVCFAVMWGYSAPPLRFKSRPGLDLFVHAAFVQAFPYVMGLLLTRATWIPLDYLVLALAFLASAAGQIEQQLRDFEVDSHTDTTFTTAVGRRTAIHTLKIATLLQVALFIYGVIAGVISLYLAPFGLIVLPLLVDRFTRREGETRSERKLYALMLLALAYAGTLFACTLLA